MEEWRTIKDFENYEISNMGRVRSLPHVVTQKAKYGIIYYKREGRILKPSMTKGYYRLSLSKDGKQYNKQIHRLVAEAFIPNPENLPVVNHKDENPLNNTVENLEWCTVQYNSNYGTAIARKRTKLVGRPKTKEHLRKIAESLSFKVGQFDLEGNLINVWSSAREAGRNGFDQSHVSACCRGVKQTHKGYRWQYLN